MQPEGMYMMCSYRSAGMKQVACSPTKQNPYHEKIITNTACHPIAWHVIESVPPALADSTLGTTIPGRPEHENLAQPSQWCL